MEPPRGPAAQSLMDHVLDLVAVYGDDGRYRYANAAHLDVLGYAPEELLGTMPLDYVHPDEAERVAEEFAHQLLVSGTPEPVAHRVRHKDGSWHFVESIAVNLGDDPSIGGIVVTSRDVTERHRADLLAEEQARILETIARGRRLTRTLDEIVEMVERWITGVRGLIVVVDETTHELRVAAAPGLTPEETAGFEGFPIAGAEADYPGDLVAAPIESRPEQPETGRLLRDRGYRHWWAASVNDSDDGHRLGGIVMLRTDDAAPTDADRSLLDIASNLAGIAIERDRAAARLAHQASHDALTGLPNRDVALDRLAHITRHPRRGGPNTALMFLDIDRFKVLNDSVGHDAGDRLLVEMGARLHEALRPGDLVARFGGDEFVMVCENVGDANDAYAMANRVLDVVQEPFTIGGTDTVVTASIGIVMVDDREPEALLRDSDAAMYWAKERGRARVEIFDDTLRQRVVARLDIERELRRVVEQGDLVLHYQPVVSLDARRLAGFEALLRWPHPTRGLLRPDAFLGVAEETGLMLPIGRWVREEACRQAARWAAEHPDWGPFVMGVNLSSVELHDRDLTEHIAQTVRDTGIPRRRFALEITEHLFLDDVTRAQAVLLALRDFGILLALDDFGVGAAPLVHLKELPIDSVKIDRAFVAGIGTDKFDDAIVEATIDLAVRLELIPIAEGVETAAQEERLREAGCWLAQGYQFARPLPPAEIEELLGRHGGPITTGRSVDREHAPDA